MQKTEVQIPCWGREFCFFSVWINCLKLKSGFIVNKEIESFQNYYFFDDFLLQELNFKILIIFWSQFHDKCVFGFCVNWLSFHNCAGNDNNSRDFRKLTMLTYSWHIHQLCISNLGQVISCVWDTLEFSLNKMSGSF